jgi:hypothetical protein
MKQFIKATTNDIKGVVANGENKVFDEHGTFIETDEGKAKEIEERYGIDGTGDVVGVDYEIREGGHVYFFGALRSPKARANYKRIFGHD